MSNDTTTDETLPEFEDATDEQDDELTLECWNCGTEFPAHTYAHVVDQRQDLAAEACPTCGIHFRTPPQGIRDFDTVYWTAEDHPAHTLGEDEVARRMPALDLIADKEIRAETAQLTANAPAYFWRAPASSSKYHHPVCREDHGLWTHTLMTVTAVCRLEESYREQDRLPLAGHDHAIAAAILHDQRKHGPHGTTRGKATTDHAPAMAEAIAEESDLPDAVADAVRTHMGPWYDDNEPDGPLQDLLHTADMMASTANATLKVPGPVPEELADLGVEEAKL